MDSKKKYAAALRYDIGGEEAPKLLAKGVGYVAENIVKTAKESGVSIYQDEKLAQQLQNLEMGEEIPRELYEVVAEVLIFIAKMDQNYAFKKGLT